MTVKGIFKVLLGTIIIMVVGSLALEMINITTTSLQLTQMSRIACRQAAVLFSQETYKDREYDSTAGGAVNMDNIHHQSLRNGLTAQQLIKAIGKA